MKKLNSYLFKALPAVAILVLMISSACSSSTPPQPTTPTQQGSISEPYSVAPPYANPANWDAVPRYTVQELKQKLDNKEKLLVVDVRYPEEFAVDHLPGAVSAPLQTIIDGKWLPTGGINDAIVLY